MVNDYQKTIEILRTRFLQNLNRHKGIEWISIQEILEKKSNILKSVIHMENSGGEPDIVVLKSKKTELAFVDFSIESPVGRRSLCYDPQALKSRKKHKPENSAVGYASEIGIDLLDEELYQELQDRFGPFDNKTSSWILTPSEVRSKGGSLFGDHRFGRTFIYHNGAESYYASRGFRGFVRL